MSNTREPRIEVRHTAHWQVFRALRWLGLKKLAYAVFKNEPAFDVYVNGRLKGSARIRRKDLERTAGDILRATRSTEVPEVPRTTTPPELQ